MKSFAFLNKIKLPKASLSLILGIKYSFKLLENNDKRRNFTSIKTFFTEK